MSADALAKAFSIKRVKLINDFFAVALGVPLLAPDDLHSLNAGMFELAQGYRERGMSAYVDLQEREFALEADGYTATKHQREVGAGYFDKVMQAVSKDSSTLALHGSTEEEQFA